MGLKPCLSVIANETDITSIISDLYEYISITDGTGYESDTCVNTDKIINTEY